MTSHVIAIDLAKVYKKDSKGKSNYLTTLAWGDDVEVVGISSSEVQVELLGYQKKPDGSLERKRIVGFIKPPAKSELKSKDLVIEKSKSKVLKADFVDVQQGDGAVIETPKGKIILIDGGDNQLFARYLAARYPGTSLEDPRVIDCILVTHGDADHFAGLTEVFKSESHDDPAKSLFIRPLRVFHNGLVKRPSTLKGKRVTDERALGPTKSKGDRTVIVDLHDDLLAVEDTEMNAPFKAWKKALKAYSKRGDMEMRRLAKGSGEAFEFLKEEEIRAEVLGPLETRLQGAVGLEFLGTPRPEAHYGAQPTGPAEFIGKSASHTINGHSVILRLTYGDVSFLYAGDLNEQAEGALLAQHKKGDLNLQADVLKVPHHGSADFSGEFLQAVSPLISVVSSGDESARKEYIHPRATLMASLGQSSRQKAASLVFVTELVAFFQMEGYVRREFHRLDGEDALVKRGKAVVDPKAKAKKSFFAFSRGAFGIVKMRTDGKRLLVWTNSGQLTLKEAYAYEFSLSGVTRSPLRRA